MCGILIAALPELPPGLESRLRDALVVLAHRGPDNMAHWADRGAFLGHTRLSIVGTGSNANQPYFFQNLVLSYNGEVFNYIELRRDLIAQGYAFDTESDTEVVIKAYHRYGSQCFDMFNGMWALAIYDRTTCELVLCRDRFGQKPLFFAQRGDALYAASELQALAGLVDIEPNFAAIEAFLKEGDFGAAGNTFFDGVFEFPAACYARILHGRIVDCRRYWRYPEPGTPRSTSQAAFDHLLDDAVSLRLRTDVDYCLLLSGGCDSTIVAGITRELIGPGARLSAFTFSSGDKDDESRYAAEVARDLDVGLHLCKPHVVAEEYVARLRRLVRHLGRGHSSPAVVSIDQLYERLRDCGYKVALDGQGADELLGGYKHYQFHLLLDLIRRREWRQIPALLSDLRSEGILGVMLMAMRNSLPLPQRKWLRMVYGYERLFSSSGHRQLRRHPLSSPEPPYRGGGSLERYLHKLHSVGLRNLLYYGDIVAMANSVENRSPFMDHRLVEMSFSSDFRLKCDRGRDKAALRSNRVYQRFEGVLERKKVGFAAPAAPVVNRHMVAELQASPILAWPIFDRERIARFLGSGAAARDKYARFLFRLFQVHLWQQEFLALPVPEQGSSGTPAAPPRTDRQAAGLGVHQ